MGAGTATWTTQPAGDVFWFMYATLHCLGRPSTCVVRALVPARRANRTQQKGRPLKPPFKSTRSRAFNLLRRGTLGARRTWARLLRRRVVVVEEIENAAATAAAAGVAASAAAAGRDTIELRPCHRDLGANCRARIQVFHVLVVHAD